jgi:hypothetical protein
MDLAELNRRVTSAIFRAERLAQDSWEAQEAYREVSLLEEEIAGRTGPAELEGAIAREGAVRAAIRAGQHLRALSLATRYLEDDATPADLRAELKALGAEADKALPDGAAEVRPVRVHIAA